MAEIGALEIVIGAAVVVAAAVVLWAPRLAAVVSFLCFGVVLTVLWAVLGAPDIAVAEAALGTGVTGALFMAAIGRREDGPGERRWPAAVLAAGFAVALVPVVTQVADGGGGPELPVAESGVGHPVTAVLLAFRAYDTLLEIAVLLAAVVVARALSRSSGAGRAPRAADGSPSPLLSAFAVRLLPIVVVAAGWLLFAGSSLPGGAFQAGAVLAGALILARLSGLRSPGPGLQQILVGAGMLAFLAFAAAGFPAAAPLIIALETVLTLAIACALALLVAEVAA